MKIVQNCVRIQHSKAILPITIIIRIASIFKKPGRTFYDTNFFCNAPKSNPSTQEITGCNGVYYIVHCMQPCHVVTTVLIIIGELAAHTLKEVDEILVGEVLRQVANKHLLVVGVVDG